MSGDSVLRPKFGSVPICVWILVFVLWGVAGVHVHFVAHHVKPTPATFQSSGLSIDSHAGGTQSQSCWQSRAGTIRPFASPLGSLGRPIFGLVALGTVSELLYDYRLYRSPVRFNAHDIKRIELAARASEKTVSEWIRGTITSAMEAQ